MQLLIHKKSYLLYLAIPIVAIATQFELCASAATFTKVVASGDAAPGIAGATVGNVYGGLINNAGQITLEVSVVGPGIESSSNPVFYGGSLGSLSMLERPSAQPPGFPTVFGNSTTNKRLAQDGRITFNASLNLDAVNGITSSNDTFTWIGVPGSVSVLLREGDAAPGLAGGELLNDISGTGIVTSTGKVLENQVLRVGSGGVTTLNDSAVFYGSSPAALAPIAREGDQAPDAPLGALFNSVSGDARGNHVKLTGALRTGIGGVTSNDDTAIWVTNSLGNLKIASREGNEVQGLAGLVDPGTKIASFGTSRMNSQGTVIVESSNLLVDGTHASSSNDRVVLYGNADIGLQVITREGTQVPGMPAEVNYANSTGDTRIADSGQIMLNPVLAGSGITNSNDNVLFVGTPGSMSVVAREGDQAPGYDPGWVLRGWSSSGYNLNDNGWVALITDVSNDGGTTNFAGLFVRDPSSGLLQLVVKEGDSLEVSPGTFKTISNLDISLGTSSQNFNNQNQLYFGVFFAEGGEGAYIATVPEPNSLMLAGLAVVALIPFTRRGGKMTIHCSRIAGRIFKLDSHN